MRDYGRVYSKFWTSADMHALSDDGRMLALYLLSGPHGTIAGVCRLPDGYMAEDLLWSSERVSKGFAELAKQGFANRCETTKWVWIRHYFAWNNPGNPNQWKSARKIAGSVPSECVWKPWFDRSFAIAAGDPLTEEAKGFERVPEWFSLNQDLNQDLNQEQNQEQNQKQEQKQNKGKNKPFRKGSGKPAFDPTTVTGLDPAAWSRWVEYRAERKPALKPASLGAAATLLAKYGTGQAAVVEHSIGNGYQGLVEPRSLNGGKPHTTRKARYDELTDGAPDAAHKDQGFG